jgi:hypothetical protein
VIITVALKLRVQQIDLTDGSSGEWFARVDIVTDTGAKDTFDPGTILLSFDCRCAAEVIEETDRMIRELEGFKAQALKMAWNGKGG